MTAKRKPIKVIVFDLGGVVVHGSYLEFINHYCKECLTSAGMEKILALERDVNLGNLSESEFYRALRNVFGIHLTPKEMHKIIVKKSRKDKRLLKLIKRLGKKRVAMFTNSIGDMALEVMRVQKIPFRKLFRRVFLSTRMHKVKPDIRAYREILGQLKVKPQEAVMVDDREVNIAGAKKIGMNAILYKNSSQFRRNLKKFDILGLGPGIQKTVIPTGDLP